jgi:hypothetical protein
VKTNICYYNWLDEAAIKKITDAKPSYIISNSPAGPWKGNAVIKTFTGAGIKYFEYLDGGYEGTKPGDIPNDLQSNLRFMKAVKKAGGDGVFLDQVASSPQYKSKKYLIAIANKATELELSLVFNVGVAKWDDWLVDYSDYISSSENWRGEALSDSQAKWKERTWLLSKNTATLEEAVRLSKAAGAMGIDAQYACPDGVYQVLAPWFGDYMAAVRRSGAPDRSALIDLRNSVKGALDKIDAMLK